MQKPRHLCWKSMMHISAQTGRQEMGLKDRSNISNIQRRGHKEQRRGKSQQGDALWGLGPAHSLWGKTGQEGERKQMTELARETRENSEHSSERRLEAEAMGELRERRAQWPCLRARGGQGAGQNLRDSNGHCPEGQRNGSQANTRETTVFQWPLAKPSRLVPF